MIKFIKYIFKHIISYFYGLVRDYYLSQEYTDVCTIWSDNKRSVKFYTRTTSGETADIDVIRKSCGQNKIALFGPFQPHRIILLVMPSVYKNLGFKKTRRFIKSWPGSSKIEDREVIFYSLPFRK